MPDHRDQQQSGQQHLDRGDQGPHAGAAHGRVAHLLGGGAVAVEEEFLAADAAQHPQPGDGVRGQFGGAAGLLPLDVGPPGGPGQERQYREGQHGQAQDHDDTERRFVDDEGHADQHDGQRGRREAGDGLHEPADLLHVTGGDGHDLPGRDAAGQGRAQQGGLAGQQLLDAGRRGDPVGDGGAVQEGVAQRVARTAQRHEATGDGESGAGAVDDGLDGETDAERQGGDGGEVQQAPGQRLELSTQLVAEKHHRNRGPEACVRHTRVGERKVLDLHDVPVARVREVPLPTA